jgi:hypothetical protein
VFLIHFLDALTVEGFWATLFICPGVVGADVGVGVGAGDGSLRTSGSLSLACTHCHIHVGSGLANKLWSTKRGRYVLRSLPYSAILVVKTINRSSIRT